MTSRMSTNGHQWLQGSDPPGSRTGPDVVAGPADANHAASGSTVSIRGCTDACRPVERWFGSVLYSSRIRHSHGPVPWEHVDVITLGLVPHPRETCAACRAVGR
jgi:hypothetical protein